MSYVVANLGLHCELPSKDFLIRKTADEKECDWDMGYLDSPLLSRTREVAQQAQIELQSMKDTDPREWILQDLENGQQALIFRNIHEIK